MINIFFLNLCGVSGIFSELSDDSEFADYLVFGTCSFVNFGKVFSDFLLSMVV